TSGAWNAGCPRGTDLVGKALAAGSGERICGVGRLFRRAQRARTCLRAPLPAADRSSERALCAGAADLGGGEHARALVAPAAATTPGPSGRLSARSGLCPLTLRMRPRLWRATTRFLLRPLGAARRGVPVWVSGPQRAFARAGSKRVPGK